MANASKKMTQLIDGGSWDLPNCSNTEEFIDIPPAKIFLSNLTLTQTALLTVATGLEVIVLFLAAVQWWQILTKVSNEKRRNKLYFLISLFPITTVCCYIGMLSPRSALVLNSVGVFYTLTCMAVLIALLKHLFGGRKGFSTKLSYDDKGINFQSPPFCCCCKCLPEPAGTEKNLRRVEWLVLQAPIVRALVVLYNIFAVAEYRENAHSCLQISEIAAVVSLLLAIFGMHTMARLTTDKLRSYGFMTMFRMVDITLLFYTAQQPMIFENLIRFGVIDCGPILSAIDNGRYICNFVIICQLTLLSLLSTFCLSPVRSALFNHVNPDAPIQEVKTEQQTIFTDE